MRRSLLLSLAAGVGFLLCSIVSGAEPTPEQATVCGMIVDGKGMAVAGVEVKVLLDRSIISARSDGLGKFQVGVPKNQAARVAILATASSGIGVLRLHGESDASRTANLRLTTSKFRQGNSRCSAWAPSSSIPRKQSSLGGFCSRDPSPRTALKCRERA
jgi:hypothetical protein